MSYSKQRSNVLRITQLGLLAAIIIVMTLTPLGYFKTGAIEITFLTLPVILGAVILGPVDGMILGAIFGLTSFGQSFGLSAFGTLLAQANVFYTFIVCMIPRILIGLFSGSLANVLKKKAGNDVIKYGIISFVGTLTNTVLFLGLVVLLFGGNDVIESTLGDSLLNVAIAVATFNGLIELVVCTILGAVIIKGVEHALKRLKRT